MQDKEIKVMHKAKMQRYDNKDLGMQIGACVNKAVDITIAEYNNSTNTDIDKKVFIKHIKNWVDILFEIGSDKKAQLTEVKPLNIDKAVKLGDKFNKRMEKANQNIQETVMEGREREAQDKTNFQP